MTDSISRCELFNKLATIPAPPEANEFKAKVYEIINEMPIVDKWIPCSERLPKESGQYFVTEGIEQREAVIGYYSAEYGRWYAASDVSAWMPLPEPYREEE